MRSAKAAAPDSAASKEFFLTRERTLKRKFTELLMSISLEVRYSKDKILEAYCNEVFLGKMVTERFMALD